MPTLYDRVKSGEFLFLDGGTGTELARRGLVHGNAPCWSAEAVLGEPDLVRSVHEDFIRAGSDIIVSDTFRASALHLATCGMDNRWEEINTTAVRLAYEAIENVGAKRQVHVIGSISAIPPDGDWSPEIIREQHSRQAVVLAKAGAEAIHVEMINDARWGELALDGASDAGIALWAGFSCSRDERRRPVLSASGMPLEEALGSLLSSRVKVVCLTHTMASDIGACLEVLRQQWIGPIAVAPHASRSPVPNQSVADTYTPEEFRAKARQWITSGVRIIGGCCGITPDYIRTAREGIQLLG
jgi:S-methylmethionine-dependent homocysteine/selenocysteine methylase